MATLNIKDFPPELHARLKALAEAERRSLAQQVIVLLEAAVASEPQQSILDLEGLGASYWKGVDAAEHVDRERRSWD